MKDKGNKLLGATLACVAAIATSDPSVAIARNVSNRIAINLTGSFLIDLFYNVTQKNPYYLGRKDTEKFYIKKALNKSVVRSIERLQSQYLSHFENQVNPRIFKSKLNSIRDFFLSWIHEFELQQFGSLEPNELIKVQTLSKYVALDEISEKFIKKINPPDRDFDLFLRNVYINILSVSIEESFAENQIAFNSYSFRTQNRMSETLDKIYNELNETKHSKLNSNRSDINKLPKAGKLLHDIPDRMSLGFESLSI